MCIRDRAGTSTSTTVEVVTLVSPTGDANDPPLTPRQPTSHHPHADTDTPDPVPSHWRTGGPIMLAGDTRSGLNTFHRASVDPQRRPDHRTGFGHRDLPFRTSLRRPSSLRTTGPTVGPPFRPRSRRFDFDCCDESKSNRREWGMRAGGSWIAGWRWTVLPSTVLPRPL